MSHWIKLILAGLFLLTGILFAQQGFVYDGPEDEAGDPKWIREGYMTGNRVFLYFKNTTELSDWPKAEVSRWPNNYEGTKMVDGIGLLVGAKVFVDDNSVPETDTSRIRMRKDLHPLYYLQTSYREEMDRPPVGNFFWGFYPCWGYFNELSEYPAMSNKPSSWPVNGWPAKGLARKWPGEWDGRFGRGVIYAQLETYFVVNDAQDQEYLGIEDRWKYYPRDSIKIGYLYPDKVTIQKGLPWGGLGIRVEQRGFQWNNPQARDAIFWEYSIANISNYDLPYVAFGYWVDNAIGGDGADDELGYFDRKLDLAYSWDINGVGRGGLPTGTMGFAYLESPGIATDGIDNDEDGIIDERRDNGYPGDPTNVWVGPTDGIANLQLFLETYQYELSDLKPHWSADEDQDWEDGEDRNGDGIYQLGEYAGDDVGLDGVGPNELNYTGPDEGECNHKPDYDGANGCEPNFAKTDVSESDMLGLTSFMLFPIPSHSSEERWFRGDKSMWEVMTSDTLIEYLGKITNLVECFSSGPFPLHKGRTERISMSELHSYDPLAGLNSPTHDAPALYEAKRIVQLIYEKDYRFAMAPKMPTLTATPGDGYVILTWDNIADTRTRDPFVGNVNDFEGYKLYRSTDKKMADAEVITDGFGTPSFKKPIFQCDLKDGIKGFTNFGLVNGMGYNLGYDTGLVHHFIDRTVQNGRTYYYALVAYDYGAPHIGPGIAPAENEIIIEVDEAEEVTGYGKNVQVVVPRTQAAGYVPPNIVADSSDLKIGSGSVKPSILAQSSLKLDHTYRVQFLLDSIYTVPDYPYGLLYVNNGLQIYDQTDEDKLVYSETPGHFAFDNLSYDDSLNYYFFKQNEPLTTDIFDGLTVTIANTPKFAMYDYTKSGWLQGTSPMRVTLTKTESQYFPWDYDIIFTSQPDAYKGRVTSKTMKNENGERIDRSKLLTNQSFSFYVVNKTFKNAEGEYELMDLVVQDMNNNAQFDLLQDRILVGPVTTRGFWAGTIFIIDFTNCSDESQLPKPGDVYHIQFRRPFWTTDAYTFTVKPAESLDRAEISRNMNKIKVVPNPYIATNAMEPAVANYYLNQRRRLMFTHLPAQCSIRIFTMSGVLVDEIQVNNAEDNGIAHWDMTSREGLEIAAGVYLYHVRATTTGDEVMGKFAVIK